MGWMLMPNGSGGTMMLYTGEHDPTQDFEFERQGVSIEVSIHTGNEKLAEHIKNELIEQLKWQEVEEGPVNPWENAFLGAMVCGIVVFVIGLLGYVAGDLLFDLPYHMLDEGLKWSAIAGGVASVVGALLGYSLTER